MPAMSRERRERLTWHVDQLAADHNVEIVYKSTRSPRAFYKKRLVRVPPIRSQKGYFTILHEIGHIVTLKSKPTLEKEGLAWRWALDNAIEEPTPGTCRMIYACLKSYLLWAMNRQHRKRPPIIPDEGSHFHTMISKMYEFV